MHFCAALFLSAILSAPWRELSSAALAIGITGAFGLVYTAVVVRRVSKQTVYALVFEDWLFHTALPFLAYATLLSAALTLVHHAEDALFGIASASVLLLFIGIHNAWDSVTFIAAVPEDVQLAQAEALRGAETTKASHAP